MQPHQPQRRYRPRKKGRPLLWALASMVVLVALLGSGAAMRTLGHVDETKAARSTADKSKKPAVTASPQPPGPGDKVRDGEFEFVVQKVDCSATTVSNQILRRTADGKFCIVSLSVRNLDTESKLFSSKLQNAYDARGDKFNDDVLADFYANDNSQTFFKDIPPNGVVTGKVVFDVPKTTKLTTIELHDSLFSGGVRVKLP